MKVHGKLPKKIKPISFSKRKKTKSKPKKISLFPVIEVDKPIVVVEVLGGVATISHIPNGISVFLIDHDGDADHEKKNISQLIKGPAGEITDDIKKLLKKSGVKL
jgi:hypothetical protein